MTFWEMSVHASQCRVIAPLWRPTIEIGQDPNFLRWPSCVICEDQSNVPLRESIAHYDFVKSSFFKGACLPGNINPYYFTSAASGTFAESTG
jgi:hypothetical protein